MISLARAALLSVALAGCVEQNARWDPPASSSSSTGDSAPSEASDASTSSGAVEQHGSSDATGFDASSSSSSSSSSTGEPAEPCEGNWNRICGGECRDTKDDPEACGALCTDCTGLFGPNARCRTGVCRPPGGGGGDD